MDVYSIITDKIIKLLEAEGVPWRRPWTSAGLPRNLISKQPYRGLNYFCFQLPNMCLRIG
jgi:antirestriction protein ArdC